MRAVFLLFFGSACAPQAAFVVNNPDEGLTLAADPLALNAPPEVSIESPENGAVIVEGVEVLLYTADDQDEAALDLRWYLDGSEILPVTVADGADGASLWTFGVDAGQHQLIVWGRDAHGLGASDRVSFVVAD